MADIKAPNAMYPGLTNDPLWESIISRHWREHIDKFGIGWDTSGTSDAERAHQLSYMQKQYLDARAANPDYSPPTETQKTYIGKGFTPTGDLEYGKGSLEEIAMMRPMATQQTRETGEGSITDYGSVDPGAVARSILAQPAQKTIAEIRRDFPLIGALPDATLDAMGKDWRNAYGQFIGALEPANLPKGYAKAVTRFVKGQPEALFGDQGKMFVEALPYIQYSPEYGLVVPQQGITPYKDSGWLKFVPSVFLGAAAGPIAGALGGGALGAAGAGAISGGLGAAINQGDVLQGALTGGVTGGLTAGVSPSIDKALSAANITGAAADAVKAGALAAGKAAITGGDPLQAALVAATGAGVGTTVSALDVLKDVDPTIAKAITAAASGAAKAAVSGGDPVQSALMNLVKTGTQAAATSALKGETPTPEVSQETQPSIMDLLAQQDAQSAADAQALQQAYSQEPVSFEYDQAPAIEIPSAEAIAATPTESWIDQGFLANEATPSVDSLLQELGKQEEEQAATQSELLGYDPRIVEAMGQSEAEQQSLADILASSQAPTPVPSAATPKATVAAPSSVSTSVPAPTPTPVPQQATGDIGTLLTLLGLASQQKKEPPPVPVVGEIKPYQFSTDLLENIYGPTQSGLLGSNEQLLKMMRGY